MDSSSNSLFVLHRLVNGLARLYSLHVIEMLLLLDEESFDSELLHCMWHVSLDTFRVSLDTFGVLFTFLEESDVLAARIKEDVVVILGVLGDQSLVFWIVLLGGGVDDDDAVWLVLPCLANEIAVMGMRNCLFHNCQLSTLLISHSFKVWFRVQNFIAFKRRTEK